MNGQGCAPPTGKSLVPGQAHQESLARPSLAIRALSARVSVGVPGETTLGVGGEHESPRLQAVSAASWSTCPKVCGVCPIRGSPRALRDTASTTRTGSQGRHPSWVIAALLMSFSGIYDNQNLKVPRLGSKVRRIMPLLERYWFRQDCNLHSSHALGLFPARVCSAKIAENVTPVHAQRATDSWRWL